MSGDVYFFFLIHLLGGWRIGVLAYWVVGVLAYWRIGLLAYWRIGWLVDYFVLYFMDVLNAFICFWSVFNLKSIDLNESSFI